MCNTLYFLIDGAQCLRNAAISLGVQDRSCLIHGCRVPNGSKKNGKRGTKGSLCSYLSGKGTSDEKSLSLTDAVKVSFTINSLIATGAHERPPDKLLWRELHNFAGKRIPKASSGALES